MAKIEITNEDVIIFYGNKAGYIKDNKAFIDPLFKREEMIAYLDQNKKFEVEWKDGVYDALINNTPKEAINLKTCRIYQLKPETDARIKFVGYDDLIMKGLGKPNYQNYRVVFDGDVATNDLDEIYSKFNSELPMEFEGHSLSMSDVVELYDESKSEFYYVDTFGFKTIDFKLPEIKQELSEKIPITPQESSMIQPEQRVSEEQDSFIMKFTM